MSFPPTFVLLQHCWRKWLWTFGATTNGSVVFCRQPKSSLREVGLILGNVVCSNRRILFPCIIPAPLPKFTRNVHFLKVLLKQLRGWLKCAPDHRNGVYVEVTTLFLECMEETSTQQWQKKDERTKVRKVALLCWLLWKLFLRRPPGPSQVAEARTWGKHDWQWSSIRAGQTFPPHADTPLWTVVVTWHWNIQAQEALITISLLLI